MNTLTIKDIVNHKVFGLGIVKSFDSSSRGKYVVIHFFEDEANKNRLFPYDTIFEYLLPVDNIQSIINDIRRL